MSARVGLLILGNQLFPPSLVKSLTANEVSHIFVREDFELCSYFKFHKHKIIFFLSAMRAYAEELSASFAKKKVDLHYDQLAPSTTKSSPDYETALIAWIKKHQLSKLYHFEIEDRFFEQRIKQALAKVEVEVCELNSPMFLNSRAEFQAYVKSVKKPFMKTFYEKKRREKNILMLKNGTPKGGKFSFDEDNRLKLPEDHIPPELGLPVQDSKHVADVVKVVERHFADHPGDSKQFWLPFTRVGAKKWLKKFLTERLVFFGPYEDALASHSEFVYHSVLTPFLNTGLLTPAEVIEAALKESEERKLSLASTEGFIRQIMGWREFIRGIDREFGERQAQLNFFKHERSLTDLWYTGETGVPPLDQTLRKVLRYGYCHHIERLMVVGSLMLLLEVKPIYAYQWFMEMFVDSADWVMGPNVYGMALFSDGGIFATKPYICGSNYYRKMGHFEKGDWTTGVDGLYWRFIGKNEKFFSTQPRLSMMLKTYQKMSPAKKTMLLAEADKLAKRLVK